MKMRNIRLFDKYGTNGRKRTFCSKLRCFFVQKNASKFIGVNLKA
ncbi:MAG: hypothetical protein UIH41_09135 [Treponemataceae bacterium]|nr:hypothetical protein [Treponemataceae bacterium]